MIINNNIQSAMKPYMDNKSVKNMAVEKTNERRGSGRKDEIILSSQAQSFSQMLKKVKDNKEIRQAEVAAIAEKVDAGQYNIDARLIAEKMLNCRY